MTDYRRLTCLRITFSVYKFVDGGRSLGSHVSGMPTNLHDGFKKNLLI